MCDCGLLTTGEIHWHRLISLISCAFNGICNFHRLPTFPHLPCGASNMKVNTTPAHTRYFPEDLCLWLGGDIQSHLTGSDKSAKLAHLPLGLVFFSTHFPYHLPQSQLTWQSEQIHNVCPACALVPLPNHPWSHSVANVIRVIALSFVGLGGPCCLFCLSPAFAYIKKSIHFDSVRSNKN